MKIFSKLIGLGVIAAAFACSTAFAGNSMPNGVYVAVAGGLTIIPSVAVDLPVETTGLPAVDSIRYANPGWNASAEIGYAMNNWQFAAQYLHIIGYYRDLGTTDTMFNEAALAAKGHTRVDAGMANVYYNFVNVPAFYITPFIGVGLGVAQINFDLDHTNRVQSTASSETMFVDHAVTQFAYQVIAGFSYHVTKRLAASLAYRYFATAPVDYLESRGPNRAFQSHNIEVGLTYSLPKV